MAGSLSSKKVARAARAGGSSRRIKSRSYGFSLVCFAIICIGIGTTWFSYEQRNGTGAYGDTPPLAPIAAATEGAAPKRAGDKWYEAVGFYTCDKFAPNINVSTNPYGISTSNDGVIHIAPFERKYAGHNATIGLFAKAVGLKLDSGSFQLPGDTTVYKSGTQCNGKPGELVVKEWSKASDNNTGKQIKAAPNALLLEDNYAVTIAWVAQGTDIKNIPLPTSASTLAAVKALASQSSSSTTATTAATGATPTTVAGATATTAPAATTTTTK